MNEIESDRGNKITGGSPKKAFHSKSARKRNHMRFLGHMPLFQQKFILKIKDIGRRRRRKGGTRRSRRR